MKLLGYGYLRRKEPFHTQRTISYVNLNTVFLLCKTNNHLNKYLTSRAKITCVNIASDINFYLFIALEMK